MSYLRGLSPLQLILGGLLVIVGLYAGIMVVLLVPGVVYAGLDIFAQWLPGDISFNWGQAAYQTNVQNILPLAAFPLIAISAIADVLGNLLLIPVNALGQLFAPPVYSGTGVFAKQTGGWFAITLDLSSITDSLIDFYEIVVGLSNTVSGLG